MKMKKESGSKREKVITVKERDLNKLKEHSKKLRELEENIAKADAQILQFKEKYLRTAAEFDNYKKRADWEKQDIFRFGMEQFVMQLLPFDDIFETVIKQLENSPSPELIYKGIEMLKKELTKLLEGMGVKKIETAGKAFNPKFHEATETVETENYSEGVIVGEDRSGYMLHDRVLRPAFVRVAKKPAEKTSDDEDTCTGKD